MQVARERTERVALLGWGIVLLATQQFHASQVTYILAASDIYIEAFETITGLPFVKPDASEPASARIRRNLQPFMEM